MAIATTGRKIELAQTINLLRQQTRLPDTVFICPAAPEDIDAECLVRYPCPAYVLSGGRGSAAQRNTILRHLTDEDIVLFLDDDFLPAPDYLHELECLFASWSDTAVLTGHVVADGASGPGISFQDALKAIDGLPEHSDRPPFEVYGAYGCNMAVRVNILKETGVVFDENLPLYGWWEDIDFSRRLKPFGKVMRSRRLRGVHRGTKSGRSSGKRVGYSQVANILYLARKGSVTRSLALKQITKNVGANLLSQLRPEPWIDRRGRLFGNILAFSDAFKGRIDPGRIMTLE